jgi:hypothetical protein
MRRTARSTCSRVGIRAATRLMSIADELVDPLDVGALDDGR